MTAPLHGCRYCGIPADRHGITVAGLGEAHAWTKPYGHQVVARFDARMREARSGSALRARTSADQEGTSLR